MNKQYTYHSVSLRFRRWSRKGYAAFFSIQKAVTIGHLSSSVIKQALAKSRKSFTSKQEGFSGENNDLESLDSTFSETKKTYENDLAALLLILTLFQIVKQPTISATNSIIYTINNPKKGGKLQ